jgi:hypothetical protein
VNQGAQTGLINGLKKCADQLIIDLTAYTDSQPEIDDETGETEEDQEAEEAETEELWDI